VGIIDTSGQILIGAVFFLVACTLFLFSVYDVSLAWRDRAKLQQTVDAAALTSAAVMSDLLAIMGVYNALSWMGLSKTPKFLAFGELIDSLCRLIETTEVIGSLTAILSSDTRYILAVTRPPKMQAELVYGPRAKFVIKNVRDPGQRVVQITGTVSSIGPRYLLKKFFPKTFPFMETVIFCTAEAGVFRQKGLIRTYVPILLK